MPAMNIGDAAAAAGVTPKMIRHYESLGLMPQAQRTEAGYRLYGERELAMLRFIRQARSLGFAMQEIEGLLSLWRDPGRRSHDVKVLARRQLEALQERQRELVLMRATLEGMVAQCRGDDAAHCVILEQLALPAAAPTAVPRARRDLKEVRPGEKRPVSRARRPAPAAAPASAHSALAAWTHTFVRTAAA